MATAAELLAGATEVDSTLIVDSAFRTIKIPSGVPNLGVEYDDEVLRLDFKMPRYVSNTDLSGFSIRINYINARGESDVYTVRDAVVDSQYITFTWLVGPTATRYKGYTKFNICAKTLKADGITVDREFNTTIATLPVLEGLEVDESIVSEYPDLIEQWRRELFGTGDSVIADIEAKRDEALRDIENKNTEYTEAVGIAQEGIRTKADAIVCTIQGENIFVSDSSNDYVSGLKIFGKTTQAADPTPDSPQDLVNIASNNPVTVCVYGKNLLPVNSVTVNNHQAFLLDKPLPVGKYTFRAHVVSNDTDGDKSTVVFMNGSNNVAYIPLKRGDVTYTFNATIPINKVDFCAAYNYSEGTGDTATWTNIQLECGEGVTEYELYREEQSITITIAGGLPGIPVSSGGNYNDANGQQWICDEIDFERGVYIKRIGHKILDGVTDRPYYATHSNGQHYIAIYPIDIARDSRVMSDRYMFSQINWSDSNLTLYGIGGAIIINDSRMNSADDATSIWSTELPEVRYVLATPIETPLTAEEIQWFKFAHTNFPNTTVLNDAGATMELKYNADTKTWIDNLSRASATWLATISLPSSAWTTVSTSLHSQVVSIAGITNNSRVDLYPTVAQLAIFHEKDVAFVTENDNGTVTVYAIGDKPLNDYTMQAQITEVLR